MPAQAIDQYDAVLGYLRDKYWDSTTQIWAVATLRTLRDTAFASGTDAVTITSTSSEAGGAASSVVTFDKLTLVAALNDLIAEAAEDSAPPVRARGMAVDFSQRCSGT